MSNLMHEPVAGMEAAVVVDGDGYIVGVVANPVRTDPTGTTAQPTKHSQPAATTGNLTAAAQDVTATGLGPYAVALVTAQGTYTGANLGFYYDGALGVGARVINAQTGVLLTSSSVALTNNSDDNTWIVPLYGGSSLQVYANAVASGTVAISIQPSSAPVSPIVSVSGTTTVSGTVDTELQAASALSDAMGNPSTASVGANNLLWHTGSVWVRQQSAGAVSDSMGGAFAAAGLMGYNGSSWDRVRNNWRTQTGDTGAKTATFNGATQTNYDARGAYITILLGTVTGTTPTLAAKLQWSPDGGTTWKDFGPAMANLTTTGQVGVFAVYPANLAQAAGATPADLALGGDQTVRLDTPLPRTWRVAYTIGGSSPSFTISSVQVQHQL